LKSYQDNSYILKFTTIINKIILEDLPTFLNLETSSLDKLSKLLYFIANSTPSEISFSYLANKIKVHTVLVENVMTLLSKI
jgi:predicted AAA+ superfamily ATPase